jgi:hypothetical protein
LIGDSKKIELVRECIRKVEQMLSVNRGVLDSDLKFLLDFVLVTLQSMERVLQENKDCSESMKSGFGKVLSLSVRLFDGNDLDHLLWELDREMDWK